MASAWDVFNPVFNKAVLDSLTVFEEPRG